LALAQEELAQAGLFDLSVVNERVEEVVERLIGLTNKP
jgi:guanylate kinase